MTITYFMPKTSQISRRGGLFRPRSITTAILAVCVAGTLAGGFSAGPGDGQTDAPGESNCAKFGCHTTFAIDSGPGVFIVGAPLEYVPGETIDITVALSQSGQTRWGFEVTALDAANQPLGQMLITNSRTLLSISNGSVAPIGRQYVKHSALGTDAGLPDASQGWSFKWIAPPDAGFGPVTFWGTGSAANFNTSSSGDYIYTDAITVAEGLATDVVDETPEQLPGSFALHQNFPNPFNPATMITFDQPVASTYTLTVYNILGQRVGGFTGSAAAGVVSLQWDAGDNPSGVYFYRLSAGNFTATRKMVVLK